MVDNKTHSEKTSAEKKIVGFEFQYYFFLYRVLQLRKGESVGLEVVDDVHTQLDDDRQILFQLKHTLQERADGTPAALGALDADLWKTLSNWSKVISDGVAGRKDDANQVAFVDRTDFVLTTNKSRSVDPTIPNLLVDPTTARASLEQLCERSNSDITQKHIRSVLELSDEVLVSFIKNVRLDVEVDELIAACKTLLEEKQIPPNRIEQLFSDLDSRIRQDNFLTVKSGGKVCISFADFNLKYRVYFDSARSVKLQVRSEYDPLPESLDTQIFIQQLLDIGDIRGDDIEDISRLTRIMKHCERNLLRWEVEGEVTRLELDQFDLDAITLWRNSFRACHRDLTRPADERGLQIIDKLREALLKIREQDLGPEFSNGQFYKLADFPKIGFRTDWESVYGSTRETA